MRNWLPLIIPLCLFLSSCTGLQGLHYQADKQAKQYKRAVENAMVPNEDKISRDLISIKRDNKDLVWKVIDGEEHLLVVTWKKDVSYYEPHLNGTYNTGDYPIWVTTAPELAERMEKVKPRHRDLRLKQLLGLPPNNEYNYFVEFWVKPENLFRPCPDQGIADTQCELGFPQGTHHEHEAWINRYRLDSYYALDLYHKYPWTQLGYTYDWNPRNKSHVGLSEFVIAAKSDIVVNAIHETHAYLDK
jgi:hypothetical protein